MDSNDLQQLIVTSPTLPVARALLGQQLRIRLDDGWHQFTIVETEAYTQDDPACHAYQATPGQKITPRAANLYQRPGLAYVYLIYGMYYCLNVVTEAEGVAGAVLFRGVVGQNTPFSGQNLIGPGRLCKALGITTALHNGLDMLSPDSPLQLAQGEVVGDEHVRATPRIGITKGTEVLWRFIDTRHVKR